MYVVFDYNTVGCLSSSMTSTHEEFNKMSGAISKSELQQTINRSDTEQDKSALASHPNTSFTFPEIEQSLLFKKTAQEFLGKDYYEVIIRPACFFVRLSTEDARLVKRIIVLPPHGFTADNPDLLSPHPEARRAQVKILGKINPGKKGYKPVLNELAYDYSFTRDVPTEKNSAYARFSEKYCGRLLKSWRNWFYVVHENGQGDFHNLTNLSSEWIVLLLKKELQDQKTINLDPYLARLPQLLQEMVCKIEETGDAVFRDKVFVEKVFQFPEEILVPVFIQMLNIHETGQHENCTFFGFLLKLAKKNKHLVLSEVQQAIRLHSAPHYYLADLEKKLSTI